MAVVLTAIVVGLSVATVAFLVYVLVRSIQSERKSSGVKRIWGNFALGIVLCILFFVSWFGQGLAEWQRFRDDQQQHGEPVAVREFVTEFAQSTLENWQSEFLQLFSFVVLAALYVHRGSAESRDSDDRMEEKLDRIEKRLKEMSG